MSRTHRLLLACAATDNTFALIDVNGREALVGKCIHCNRKLMVELDATRPSSATLEHILPRTHGGTDAPENLALACRGCNTSKGVRLDPRRLSDETLQRVIALLSVRRAKRMRSPLPIQGA